MPCSCKAKSKVTYIQPKTKQQITAVITVNKDTSIQQLSNSFSTESVPTSSTAVIQDLDLRYTTIPDQLCFNCVRKHISLGYLFLQNGNNDAACGQFMCARQHLLQKFPGIAQKMYQFAILIMKGWAASTLLPAIDFYLSQLKSDPQEDWGMDKVSFVLSQTQQDLLTLCFIYSLLFVQVGYEQVNKSWATGHLAVSAWDRFRNYADNTLEQKFRPLWKLIQSMQFGDQNYYLARSYLQTLIKETKEK